MKFDNKKLYINNLKIKLELLIDNSLIEIPNNLTIIKINLEKHFNFINFVDSVKIYEIYKWTKLKEEYNKIKKKINIDKKLYPQIIKIYGIINSYYTVEETECKNKIIKKINEDNILLLIQLEEIKKIHNNIIIKCKYYIRNINIIKINQENNEYDILIKKLYEIHSNLKKVSTELKILKYNKNLNKNSL